MAAVPYESIQAFCDAHIAGHDEAAEAKAVAACNAGLIFHAHMDGSAKWSDLQFSFAEGIQEPHLRWHLKNTPPHPEQHLGLHQILGISQGKKTDVLKGVEAPDDNLFTLHTTESAMNLEANSPADIYSLALGVFHNQKKAGTQILTFMSAGQTFAIHGQGETAPVTIAEGSVVYVKDSKQFGMGSLQVFDKPLGTPGATMVLTFPVHTITMVSPGGIHPWLQEHRASGAIKNEPDNTFTITAPDGVDLHLEAPNRVTHDNWLNALTIYVQSYHAYMEQKAAQGEQPAAPTATSTAAPVAAAAATTAAVASLASSVPAVAEVQAPVATSSPAPEKKAVEDTAAVSAGAAENKQAMLTRQPSQSPAAFNKDVHVTGDAGAAVTPGTTSPRQVLIDGADFTAFFDTAVDGAAPQIVHRRLTVFYVPSDDASMGAIHWCEPGERKQRPDNRLPFGRISDVYLGKQHKIFHNKEADSVDKQCAFSLMASKAWGLHLVADNHAVRQAWLNGIRDVFTNHGKVVSENAPQPINPVSVSITAGTVEEKKTDYIDFIRKGTDVKVFFPADAKPQKEKILPLTYGFTFTRHTDRTQPGFFIYWYPASKAFYWSPSRDIQATEGTKIKFSEITEIDTKSGWGAVPPSSGTGIIIRTTPEKGQFFLEAASPDERNKFLDGIKQLQLELDIEAKMAAGDHANLEKELVPHSVRIFYDPPTDGKGEGTIYYCHQGLREHERKPEHSIALSSVTDVFTGKLHAADKLLEKMVAQTNPKLNCLFTIRSATAQLILLAPDEPTRTSWLHGLKQAIEKYGGVVKAVAPPRA